MYNLMKRRVTMRGLSPVRVLFICCLPAVMVGCATTPRVLNPAKMPEVSMMDNVAVIPFSGSGGSAFTAGLQNLLASQFTVTVPEQAEGIFRGQVLESSVSDSRYTQRVETCDHKGPFRACKEGTKRQFDSACINRTATFKVKFSIEDAKTNNVLYNKTAGDTESDTYCQHHSDGIKSGNALLQAAHASVLQEIRRDVAPYYTGGKLDINPVNNFKHWGWLKDDRAEKTNNE